MNHLTYPVVAHVACIVIVAEKYEVLEWYVRKSCFRSHQLNLGLR